MRKIKLLKTLDGVVGALAVKFLPRPCRREVGEILSLLLIRPGGIGDALLLAPVVRLLRHHLPDVAIDALAEKRNAAVFSMVDGIRRVYCYDDFGSIKKVLKQTYDVVIDTEQWYRLSAVVARLVRAPVKVGFSTNARRRMFTVTVDYDSEGYEAEVFGRLLEPLSLSTSVLLENDLLVVPESARKEVGALIDNLKGSGDLVVLFPGASVPEKRWSSEKFHALVDWCEKQGAHVVVVGGEQDREAGAQIVSGLSALDLTGKTTLVQTAAVLERATVVVSTDSGILHLASALRRPTVSLFGASSQSKWAPRGPSHVVIDKSMDCSPCSLFGNVPKCPIDMRCMDEISISDVSAAVNRLLTFLKNE